MGTPEKEWKARERDIRKAILTNLQCLA
jgi:hypothetical protein